MSANVRVIQPSTDQCWRYSILTRPVLALLNPHKTSACVTQSSVDQNLHFNLTKRSACVTNSSEDQCWRYSILRRPVLALLKILRRPVLALLNPHKTSASVTQSSADQNLHFNPTKRSACVTNCSQDQCLRYSILRRPVLVVTQSSQDQH